MQNRFPHEAAGRRYTGLLSRLLWLIGIVFALVLVMSVVFAARFFHDSLMRSVEELEEDTLQVQTANVDALLHRYRLKTYEMAVDSELLRVAKLIGAGEATAETTASLRSMLNGYISGTDYLAATVALPDGRYFTASHIYDTYRGWLSGTASPANDAALAELCQKASLAGNVAVGTSPSRRDRSDIRFFHLACPMYDLLTRREYGTVVLTIGTDSLCEVLNPRSQRQNISHGMLVSEDGIVLAHPDTARIGLPCDQPEEEDVILLTGSTHYLPFTVQRMENKQLLLSRTRKDLLMLIGVLTLIVSAAFLLTMLLLRKMTRSTRTLVEGIAKMGEGEMGIAIEVDDRHEIGMITDAVNRMSGQLAEAKKREEAHALRVVEALNRQHMAETQALERQIDAHFLFNTLNSVNYTAIANGDRATSQQIRHLAHMLRYTFEKSSGIVTAAQVMDWLNDYLSLQKLRFGGRFDFSLHAEPDVRDWPMRKLLVQTFVENSVLHGFEGVASGRMLTVRFQRFDAGRMRVTITDNGKGMPPALCWELNAYFAGDAEDCPASVGVGISNAKQRLQMYYHGQARVFFRSSQGVQTSVTLILPRYSGDSASSLSLR